MGGPENPDYVAIERRLKRDLDAARQRYEVAKEAFDQTAEVAYEFGLSTSDGSHAIHSGIRRHNAAMDGYRVALERFTDFVVSGKIPEDLNQSGSVDASRGATETG